jgi:PAS domain S-box-containing protein
MEQSTILVVEDERIIAADLRACLQGFGYRVPALATSGESAIELAKKYRPDLIIMDIFLNGGMTGIEAAGIIKRALDVPVIFLTAFSDAQIIEKAKITGPYGYILKPYDEQEVRTAIEIALYHHAMDKKIKESEERFRSMFEGHSAVMLLIDPESGGIQDANPAAAGFYGFSREELHHLYIRQLCPMTEQQHSAGYTGAPWKPEPFSVSSHRLAGGEVRIVETYTTPVVTDGNIVLFSIIHDITERRKAEEALQKANRQLNLLTGITRHDILNKLTIIFGYLALEGSKVTDPAAAEHFRRIESAAQDIRTQIEFTRIYQDLGSHELQWQELNGILSRLSVPAGISLTSDVEGLCILADPMLERVFFNLLDNAVRHGMRVTDIRLSSRPGRDCLTLVWEDNGAGIAYDEKEEIFERGFGKNTGLGLFLVREILSISGISIKETGAEGKGARFEITVPAGAYRFLKDPLPAAGPR